MAVPGGAGDGIHHQGHPTRHTGSVCTPCVCVLRFTVRRRRQHVRGTHGVGRGLTTPPSSRFRPHPNEFSAGRRLHDGGGSDLEKADGGRVMEKTSVSVQRRERERGTARAREGAGRAGACAQRLCDKSVG
eukprot:1632764-Rhodomonas_salina.2